jgi:uncharacterized protein YdeI (BOF family)
MKKFATLVFTMLLAGSLALAQDTGGDKGAKTNTGGKKPAVESTTKTKTKSGKKGHHKGGKKGKKGNGTSTTPPPK